MGLLLNQWLSITLEGLNCDLTRLAAYAESFLLHYGHMIDGNVQVRIAYGTFR